MQGLLPEDVVWNPLRGRQAADVGERMLEHAEEMDAALSQLERSSLAREYLNLGRMKSLSRRVRYAVDPSLTARVQTILLRGLAVGLFLERFETDSPRHARILPEAIPKATSLS
jgi:hypothetical protein